MNYSELKSNFTNDLDDKYFQENFKDQELQNLKKLTSIIGKKVNIIGLADQNFHSVSKALKHLIDIDRESVPPPASADWLTLWFRIGILQTDYLCMLLRDYELPVVELKSVDFSGRVGMAEIKGQKENCRVEFVTISDKDSNIHPPEQVKIYRNMIQMKTYYDMILNCDEMKISWTTTYDPAMTQVATAIDLITPNTCDPSPIISWWDKIRLLLHGKLIIKANKAEYHSLANMIDPHDVNERLIFSFEQLILTWTNAKFNLSGDTSILIKTVTRDESKIAYFPRLDLTLKITYVLASENYNANDHHQIKPVSEPLFGKSDLEWDTFEYFRSVKLNIDLKLKIKPAVNNLEDPELIKSFHLYPAKIELYESNLDLLRLWIQSQAFPTRPTKRTILNKIKQNRDFFVIPKPRGHKPKLGRSYGKANLTFEAEDCEIYYFPNEGGNWGILLQGEDAIFTISSIQKTCENLETNAEKTSPINERRMKTQTGLINRQNSVTSATSNQTIHQFMNQQTDKQQESSKKSKMYWHCQNYNCKSKKTQIHVLDSQKNKYFLMMWQNGSFKYKLNTRSGKPLSQFTVDDFKCLFSKENRQAAFYLYETSTRTIGLWF